MKRYIRSSYGDPWEETTFIDRDIPAEIEHFMTLEDDDVDYTEAKKACDVFWSDYEKFPQYADGMQYSGDKKRFYNKYYNFMLKCKRIAQSPRLKNISGYGKDDYSKLKTRDLLKAVEYNFPVGWRYE